MQKRFFVVEEANYIGSIDSLKHILPVQYFLFKKNNKEYIVITKGCDGDFHRIVKSQIYKNMIPTFPTADEVFDKGTKP